MAKFNPNIDQDYSLVGIKPGIIIFKGEKIDFRIIDAEKAEALVKDGCQYIRKVKKRTKSSS